MKAFKLGEMAVVDLELFDLKGGKWAGLRQAAAKGERDGLTFEIIPTEGVPQYSMTCVAFPMPGSITTVQRKRDSHWAPSPSPI